MAIEITIPIIIALILGLGEWLKALGFDKKYLPLVSMGLGILSGLFVFGGGLSVEAVILGGAIGLSASGFFDLTKITEKQ